MYQKGDKERAFDDALEKLDWRSEFRRDYGRLIHSPSFRRLQGKTQLYPGVESDFFRNRLTHSLEVAQIAKSIAEYINHSFLKKSNIKIDSDLCEIAGLAHDIGHPPFGHQGEEALDECMRAYGGFEGNAQTLRVLAKVDKKTFDPKIKDSEGGTDFRFGLNFCYRSLSSILKYDKPIPLTEADREPGFESKPIKGYYLSESNLVNTIKDKVGWTEFLTKSDSGSMNKKFKTIECKIMDLADDIAYSTYDLEDGFKAGFYHPTNFFSYPDLVFENVAKKVTSTLGENFSKEEVKFELFKIFEAVYDDIPLTTLDEVVDTDDEEYYVLRKRDVPKIVADITNTSTNASRDLAQNGYLRNSFTSQLVNTAIQGVVFELNDDFPQFSDVILNKEILIRTEVLKNFTFESQILSPRLKVAEVRGKEIVSNIFECLTKDEGWRLMPYDYQELYQYFKTNDDKMRVICDFVAGMTDRYAIEFYGRLKSEDPATIFKPF